MTFSFRAAAFCRAAARALMLGTLLSVPLLPAFAATYAYQGTGTTSTPTSGNFSGTNFSPSIGSTSTPSTTYSDTLTFGGASYTATDDIMQVILVNNLTFSNSGVVTLAAGTGSTLSLGGTAPSVNFNGGGTTSIGLNLALTADTAFVGAAGSGVATISGAISGGFGLTANANLIFTGANTYTGTTTISSGKYVQLGSATATLGSGAVLDNGSLNLSASGLTVSNAISGSGGVSVNGTSTTATLSGSNSFTGAVVTNANTLKLGSASALGSSSGVTVSASGTLDLNGQTIGSNVPIGSIAGTITNSSATAAAFGGSISAPAGFSVTGTGNVNLSGVVGVTGSNFLTMGGTGTLTLSGSADNTNLGLTASAGTVVLSKSSGASVHALGSSGSGLTISGGTLQLAGTGNDQIADNATVDIEGGTFDLNGHSETVGNFFGGGGTITSNAGGSTSTLTIGGQNTSNGGTYSGVISNGAGTVSIAKTGTGSVTFSGTNTYSGGTTVSNGTLKSTSSSAFGTGTLSFNPTSGNTAKATFTSAAPSIGSLSSSGAGTSTIVLGNTTTPSATNLTIGSDSTSQTFGGTISDYSGTYAAATGKLTKVGTGIQTLSGMNTYTGGTAVNNGTLSGNAASYGTGAVTVAGGATVDYTQSATTGTASNTISGQGTASFGGNSASANGTGGTINYTGQDSAAQTNVQSGTVTLNHTGGSAITGPVAVAMNSKLNFGASSQIATAALGSTAPANVTLSGGTLTANGFSDGSISGSDPTTAAVATYMGTLMLNGASTLDFGPTQSGSGLVVLAFADSSAVAWSGTLNVIDYVGGKDALYVGSSNTLTPTQLASITFGSLKAVQLSNGDICARPGAERAADTADGHSGLVRSGMEPATRLPCRAAASAGLKSPCAGLLSPHTDTAVLFAWPVLTRKRKEHTDGSSIFPSYHHKRRH